MAIIATARSLFPVATMTFVVGSNWMISCRASNPSDAASGAGGRPRSSTTSRGFSRRSSVMADRRSLASSTVYSDAKAHFICSRISASSSTRRSAVLAMVVFGMVSSPGIRSDGRSGCGRDRQLDPNPRLVVLDLGLPPAPDAASEGLEALQEIIQFDPTTKVIVATGNSDRAVAMIAMQRGAYDFIEKPVQLDVLRVILQRAAYLSRLEQENRALQEQATVNGFGELLGESPPMQGIFEMIRRVAASDVPVLITGESGTGKELVAGAIHRHSMRKAGPFVATNGSAIPENLLESELSGYENGAFTGVPRRQ